MTTLCNNNNGMKTLCRGIAEKKVVVKHNRRGGWEIPGRKEVEADQWGGKVERRSWSLGGGRMWSMKQWQKPGVVSNHDMVISRNNAINISGNNNNGLCDEANAYKPLCNQPSNQRRVKAAWNISAWNHGMASVAEMKYVKRLWKESDVEAIASVSIIWNNMWKAYRYHVEGLLYHGGDACLSST